MPRLELFPFRYREPGGKGQRRETWRACAPMLMV